MVSIQNLCHLAKSVETDFTASGLKNFCPSELNFLKMHEVGQIGMYVMIFEEPLGMSAESGENSLKYSVSDLYNHTNRKDPIPQMVNAERRRSAARYLGGLKKPAGDSDSDDSDGSDDSDVGEDENQNTNISNGDFLDGVDDDDDDDDDGDDDDDDDDDDANDDNNGLNSTAPTL